MEGERGYDREWGERTREWAMRGGGMRKKGGRIWPRGMILIELLKDRKSGENCKIF